MKSLTALTLVFTCVIAQNYPTIDPQSIDSSIRLTWCQQQKGVCVNLCQDQTHGAPNDNECSEDDLSYTCMCDNGFQPNMTQYSMTIPYNLCSLSVEACKKIAATTIHARTIASKTRSVVLQTRNV